MVSRIFGDTVRNSEVWRISCRCSLTLEFRSFTTGTDPNQFEERPRDRISSDSGDWSIEYNFKIFREGTIHILHIKYIGSVPGPPAETSHRRIACSGHAGPGLPASHSRRWSTLLNSKRAGGPGLPVGKGTVTRYRSRNECGTGTDRPTAPPPSSRSWPSRPSSDRVDDRRTDGHLPPT